MFTTKLMARSHKDGEIYESLAAVALEAIAKEFSISLQDAAAKLVNQRRISCPNGEVTFWLEAARPEAAPEAQ